MPDDVPKMRAFKYESPVADRPRKTVWFPRTDHMLTAVQVITKGGEPALHSHTHLDGFWFVLKGRARFYSDEKTVFAELGQFEGVLVPRGVKYWFEQAGDEPLELMQIEASDVPFQNNPRFDMVEHAAPVKRAMPTEYIDAKIIA